MGITVRGVAGRRALRADWSGMRQDQCKRQQGERRHEPAGAMSDAGRDRYRAISMASVHRDSLHADPWTAVAMKRAMRI